MLPQLQPQPCPAQAPALPWLTLAPQAPAARPPAPPQLKEELEQQQSQLVAGVRRATEQLREMQAQRDQAQVGMSPLPLPCSPAL